MNKELEAYLDKQGWYLTAEKALDLTEHVLIFLADKMEREEPGAFNSIRYLKEARNEVALALDEEEE